MTTYNTDREAILSAYNNLNVNWGASVHSIKKQYRKLAKVWHPDNWAPGSHEHNLANEKMKILNEAYSLIKDAPLRYAHESQVNSDVEWVYKKRTYDNIRVSIPHENVFEGILRFIIGVVIGLLFVAPTKFSAYWFLNEGYDTDYFIAVPLAFGIASYFLLDKLRILAKRAIFFFRRK